MLGSHTSSNASDSMKQQAGDTISGRGSAGHVCFYICGPNVDPHSGIQPNLISGHIIIIIGI